MGGRMIVIIMGVSGSGKTTIGQRLAEELNWPFYEGDDFHPKANIEKMKNDIPLTDEDREPWLDALRSQIEKLLREEKCGVFTCSALKKSYRSHLQNGNPERVKFVYLHGSYELILQRMKNRTHHFMKEEMLKSQFEALEEPHHVLVADAARQPDEIVRFIESSFHLRK